MPLSFIPKVMSSGASSWLHLIRLFFFNTVTAALLNNILNNRIRKIKIWLVGFMVFNATFNNISIILWWSVLLVEESGVPSENHRPVTSH